MKQTISIEDEVDAIRDALYKETKNMTISERTAFTNTKARGVCKEFGIKLYRDVEIEKPAMYFAQPKESPHA